MFIYSWVSLSQLVDSVYQFQYQNQNYLNSKIKKKHGNFSWCLWTTINNRKPHNTTFCWCKYCKFKIYPLSKAFFHIQCSFVLTYHNFWRHNCFSADITATWSLISMLIWWPPATSWQLSCRGVSIVPAAAGPAGGWHTASHRILCLGWGYSQHYIT